MVPAEGHLDPLLDQVEVEHHRQVQDHDARRRHAEVVNHRRLRQRDVHRARQLTLRVGDVCAQKRGPEIVAEEDQLAGLGIDLRMRRHVADELPVVVALAPRVEVRVQLVGVTHLAERQDLPGVTDHVHVADADVQHQRRLRIGCRLLAGDLFKGPRAHPTVAVAACLAAFEVNRVDHPVTQEPVMVVTRVHGGVRSLPQQTTVELLRQAPGDPQRAERQLLRHRPEVPLEVRVVRRRGRRHRLMLASAGSMRALRTRSRIRLATRRNREGTLLLRHQTLPASANTANLDSDKGGDASLC